MSTGLDDLAPNYRVAMERWPDAPTLANHYRAVAESFDGSGHSLLETVKSFVECVCITILLEFGQPMPSSRPTTTELLVACLQPLGLENARGTSKLSKVLSAYNKLSDALNECRNEVGPVAHGKDGFLDALYSSQLRTYLLTGDALLALVLAALEGTEPDLRYTRERYEAFGDLHERIDRSVAVAVEVDDTADSPTLVLSFATPTLPDGVDLRVEPSRALFELDRAAFLEVLAASTTEVLQEATAADEEVAGAAVAESASGAAESLGPQLVSAYRGEFKSVEPALERYLGSLGVVPVRPVPGAKLVPSVLTTAEQYMGVDWRKRPSLSSGMRVALRHVLVAFGVSRLDAKNQAAHVVSWLEVQAVG